MNTTYTMICSMTARAHTSRCQRTAVACRPTRSVTAVARATPLQKQLQQQLQFEHDKATWFTAESRWRIFGFGATACSQKQSRSVDGTEYVSMAACDLASGELFNTLINPKRHDPGYRLLPARLRGLSKEEVLSEGVHVLAAFDQLVDFVHINTPPGQIPVMAGHQGFKLLFRHVEQCLQRAAAATAGQDGPTSSTVIKSSTFVRNSTSSSSGRGRRKKTALEPSAMDDLSTPAGNSSSSSSKGYQHSSWPQEWMFFDTYVMGEALLELLSSKRYLAKIGGHNKTLQQKLHLGLHKEYDCGLSPREDSLGALDALLLPESPHKASAGPRDQALVAAISTSRLAQLLLALMQEVPEELSVLQPRNKKGRLSKKDVLALCALMHWQHYTPWVCQPYGLNPADHRQGRFPNAEMVYSNYRWLEHLPSSMVLAGKEASEAFYAAREATRPGWDHPHDLLTHYFKHSV